MKALSNRIEKEPRHAVPMCERLISVDVFRGATIAAMFLVGGQAGTETYSMLSHSEWYGLTFTDCIAPCFMWIVGVGLYISLSKRLARGDKAVGIFKHVVRRAIILFGIGVVINLWLPALTALVRLDVRELDSWLLMGTLQRIAIGYLIAAAVILKTSDAKKQIAFGCALLVAYTGIFYLAPAPGFSPGDFSQQGNAVTYIDNQMLGSHSNLSHPVLNTVPSAAMVLFGSLIGRLLTVDGRHVLKLRMMLSSGVTLMIGGLLLAHWVPFTYRLWTPSFLMTVGGVACLCFALLYWTIEVRGVRFGMKALSILGMNPILMWILSVVSKSLLGAKGFLNDEGKWRSIWLIMFESMSSSHISPEMNSAIFAVIYASFLYGFAHLLYSRNLVIRI